MTWRVWLTFAALGIVWGIPYFLIKLALVEVSPVGIAWGRITLGALVLLPVAWRRGALHSVRNHLRPICAFAFTELVGPFVLIALGERWVSSSMTGILLSSLPLTVILIAPLFGLHEPLGTRRVVGLLAGFLGVVVLLGGGSVHGLLQWSGVACILAAMLGYAVGSMIVQRYLAGVDELGAVAVSLGVASVVLAAPAVAGAPRHLPSMAAALSIAVLGIVCTALALQLYFYLIARAGAARASVITYINPAVAALMGVVILREPFGVGAVAGLAMILLGSWLATSRRAARSARAAPTVREAALRKHESEFGGRPGE